ncbi:hypothetical protein [Pararhizobium gei]|uniref:hypothetical protein n=1 Tax=Pararhizobium gei TaxID=1395951 RepID=UPI0023D9B8FA|nr:hypothetical protein [Rhizobium gei]
MGYWSGYDDYRHGPTKKISLAQVFKGAPRKRLVADIVNMVRDYRRTPYEHEGSIQAGIRSALCLAGERWPVADDEARGLLAAAFKKTGVKRPGWWEGQAEYTAPREVCHWCFIELPEDLRRSGKRSAYCSMECVNRAIAKRVEGPKGQGDPVYKACHAAISRLRAKPRDCEHCKKPFRSDRSYQRLCSKACRDAARTTVEERCCEHCSTVFRPHVSKKSEDAGAGKFCSSACRWAYERKNPPTYECACVLCSTPFTGERKNAIYCSNRCLQMFTRMRQGEWPKRMNTPLFDYYFITLAKRQEPTPLTTEIFDSWFQDAA